MKFCSKCGEEKPLSEFYWHRQAKRHRSQCKPCLRQADKDYRARNREARLAYARQYSRDNKDKAKAQRKVHAALKAGTITKPERCDNCGAQGFVEGHHSDYSKALDVNWLCRGCHMRIHYKKDTIVMVKD